MPNTTEMPVKLSKGERTAQRILDAAETLFAEFGYDGTTLRQIAERAVLKEPGLYNHFSGKQALYEAVLHRALNPMVEVLGRHLEQAEGLHDYTDLPAVMTDLLLDHPQMAALFQQALQGDSKSVGNQLVQKWLNQLFQQGLRSVGELGHGEAQDLGEQAINVIAMFNITTGYFLSQRAFASMADGQLTDPENIARQKRLLRRVIRGMLVS